jgi:hypothetical protein
LPWTPATFADLSCRWRSAQKGPLSWLNAGQVVSMSDPDGPGLLAFYVNLKGKRGFLRLCTSEREVGLDIEAIDRYTILGTQTRYTATGTVGVTVGEQPWDRIQLPEGTILNSAGQPIGSYRRDRSRRVYSGDIPVRSAHTAG